MATWAVKRTGNGSLSFPSQETLNQRYSSLRPETKAPIQPYLKQVPTLLDALFKAIENATFQIGQTDTLLPRIRDTVKPLNAVLAANVSAIQELLKVLIRCTAESPDEYKKRLEALTAEKAAKKADIADAKT